MEPTERLKQMIKENLHGCNQILTPTICTLKNTPEGFASLENEIFDRCGTTGKTVGQVILEIETEYASGSATN